MKKNLVITLALLFIMGITATAFAGSFSDVPAKHWAYDAITKLSKAGIVDGYGDNTFGGEKQITRYEMAIIVAKALERSDKADAQNKALVEKLSAEFATELNTLGVRVAKLEADKPKLTFNGDFRVRFHSVSNEDTVKGESQQTTQYRLRLDGTAAVKNDTTFNFRLITSSPYNDSKTAVGFLRNNSWGSFGRPVNNPNNPTTQSTGQAMIDRSSLTTKMGEVSATVGRQSLVVGPTGAIVDWSVFSFDGVKFIDTINGVKVSAQYGRIVDRKDLYAIEVSKKWNNNATLGFGNFTVKDGASSAVSATSLGEYPLKLMYGFGSYLINSHLSLTGEISRNQADYAKNGNTFTGTPGGKNMYYGLYLKAGDQSLTKAGQSNVELKYYSVGANALALDNSSQLNGNGLTNLDKTSTNDRFVGQMFVYNYAFDKNLLGEFDYCKVTDKGTTRFASATANGSNNFSYYRFMIRAMF